MRQTVRVIPITAVLLAVYGEVLGMLIVAFMEAQLTIEPLCAVGPDLYQNEVSIFESTTVRLEF